MERWLLPDLIPFPEIKSPIRNILSLTKTIRSSSVHKAPQTQIKAVALHIQYFWESDNLKDQFSKSKNQYEKTNFKIMNHHRRNISIAPLVMKYLNTCRQDWALLQNSFPICLALSLLKWGAGVTGGRTRVCCSMPGSRKADVSFLGCSRLLGHATREACIHRAGKSTIRICSCFQQCSHSALQAHCLSRSLLFASCFWYCWWGWAKSHHFSALSLHFTDLIQWDFCGGYFVLVALLTGSLNSIVLPRHTKCSTKLTFRNNKEILNNILKMNELIYQSMNTASF